jgi:hypothetical protein
MNRSAKAAFLLAGLVVFAPYVLTQEKTQTANVPAASSLVVRATALNVVVTFVEFEGEKKVKSLPYTMVVVADSRPPFGTKMRIGSRVPLYTGKESGMQYIDVGTNIDCQAKGAQDGGFELRLTLERSWVEGEVMIQVDKDSAQQVSGQFPEPIIRQYKSDLTLLLRDGQTVESTFATDPLTGKVYKVSVTLSLLK